MISESWTNTMICMGAVGVVGVPVIIPVLAPIVSPAGNAPPEPSSQLPFVSIMHQLYAPTPPEAVKVALYGTPGVPVGKVIVPERQELQVMTSAPVTISVSCFVPLIEAASVTLTVNVKEPAPVGVPLICAVMLLKLSPGGSDPPLIAQV